ncbi:MAG: hypothetical protein LLG06_12325 [Desulfobacteraceae bacterium]|nr:hypothetical protein [Desulfobacteraceae bacterium]
MLYHYLRPIRHSGIFLLALFAAALLPGVSDAAPAGSPATQFEVPGPENASQLLPPDLLSGPHHRVREKVTSFGYMHNYTVDSDYGTFEARGDFAIQRLIREIKAIAVLHEAKKGEAYLKGLKNAAAQPIEFGQNLINDPVDTLSGVPKGIASLFQNVKTGLSSQSSKNEDKKIAQVLAVSANKRQLAKQLGVDVYSSNKVLQKEMNSLAWATALGSLTVTAALAPVGGAAVTVVTTTRTAQQLTDIVSEYPVQKLRQINEEKLKGMGIAPDIIGRFLDHRAYTPTQQTAIVAALESMTGARGKETFIRASFAAEDDESADYYMHCAQTLQSYHNKVAPIQEISVYGPLVFGRASNLTGIIPMPIDHALWTEHSADRVPDAVASFKAANRDLKHFEMWLSGTASKKAMERSSKNGVKIIEKVGDRVEYTF